MGLSYGCDSGAFIAIMAALPAEIAQDLARVREAYDQQKHDERTLSQNTESASEVTTDFTKW